MKESSAIAEVVLVLFEKQQVKPLPLFASRHWCYTLTLGHHEARSEGNAERSVEKTQSNDYCEENEQQFCLVGVLVKIPNRNAGKSALRAPSNLGLHQQLQQWPVIHYPNPDMGQETNFDMFSHVLVVWR